MVEADAEVEVAPRAAGLIAWVPLIGHRLGPVRGMIPNHPPTQGAVPCEVVLGAFICCAYLFTPHGHGIP
jgi:hypothetical protein